MLKNSPQRESSRQYITSAPQYVHYPSCQIPSPKHSPSQSVQKHISFQIVSLRALGSVVLSTSKWTLKDCHDHLGLNRLCNLGDMNRRVILITVPLASCRRETLHQSQLNAKLRSGLQLRRIKNLIHNQMAKSKKFLLCFRVTTQDR